MKIRIADHNFSIKDDRSGARLYRDRGGGRQYEKILKGVSMDQQALIKGVYLFRNANEEELASLAQIATVGNYLQGEMVFNEGDTADAMFIVELGTVDIVLPGKELAIITIGSGQAFGEMAFFSTGKRPASARSRENSSILRLPFDRLEAVLAKRPDLAVTCYRNGCAFLAKHVRTLLNDLDRRYF